MTSLQHPRATHGTILVLVLVVITVIVLELAMLSTILVRSFGEEAVTATDNTMARYALQTAFTRIEQDLVAYLIANGNTNVTTDFAAGGANAINSASLTATDPETGTTGQTTNAIISASVATKRGYFYKLMATARIGDVNITAYKWVKLSPTASCTASGGLSTILTGSPYPGGDDWDHRAAMVTDPNTGRVYFGEMANPGNFYTWSPTTGLSTLMTGVNSPGKFLSQVETVSGRVFFTVSGGGTYTYLPSTGLSTLINTSANYPISWWTKNYEVFSHATNSRVYFSDGSGNMLTWSETTGLSTIATGLTEPGNDTFGIDRITGRVYFGEYKATSGKFFTWHSGTGLSTIITNGKYPGSNSTAVYSSATNSKVLFGSEVSTNGNLYLWTQASGLSTLLVNRKWSGNASSSGPTVGFDSNGRPFFGEGGATTSNFYTYDSSTGLSTLARTNNFAGVIINPITDRVYFGSGWGGYQQFYTWKSTTGLSTLVSSANPDVSPQFTYAFTDDGTKLFMPDYGGGLVMYNESSNTLSTLDDIHVAWLKYDSVNDLLFVGGWADATYGNRVLVYTPSNGALSTVISSTKAPGYADLTTGFGYTFFGETDPTNDNFYVWSPSSSCP